MKQGLLGWILAVLLVVPSSSCGTILFSERQDEEHSAKLDPNILILDGLGLFLYIIPGLVAFGVDLYTGAIYLPNGVEKGEGPFFKDSSGKSDDAPAEG